MAFAVVLKPFQAPFAHSTTFLPPSSGAVNPCYWFSLCLDPEASNLVSSRKGMMKQNEATGGQRRPFEIFTEEEKASVENIAQVISLTEREAKATFELSKGLQLDDPTLLLTLKPGSQIRAALRMGDANGRPCDPGGNR